MGETETKLAETAAFLVNRWSNNEVARRSLESSGVFLKRPVAGFPATGLSAYGDFNSGEGLFILANDMSTKGKGGFVVGIVHVVGLGPGDVDGLPVGTYRLLQSGWPVILRTAVHPVVASLPELGVEYESLDDIYETSETFDEAYARMAKRVRERAKTHDHVIYAVPGHPLIAELSVQLLLTTTDSDVVIEIGPGQSFLDVAASRLRIDPIEGLLLLDGTQPRVDC
ncbi:SAM-dependent methyltransferase [Alicyclobacillus sacchari]|uniref:SAM-dependent methyltransferase n=1 Tax=Alicyclobacillus sacchari TaxID=392010 RepID=UPI003D672572